MNTLLVFRVFRGPCRAIYVLRPRVKISGGDPEHNDPSDKAKMSSIGNAPVTLGRITWRNRICG